MYKKFYIVQSNQKSTDSGLIQFGFQITYINRVKLSLSYLCLRLRYSSQYELGYSVDS